MIGNKRASAPLKQNAITNFSSSSTNRAENESLGNGLKQPSSKRTAKKSAMTSAAQTRRSTTDTKDLNKPKKSADLALDPNSLTPKLASVKDNTSTLCEAQVGRKACNEKRVPRLSGNLCALHADPKELVSHFLENIHTRRLDALYTSGAIEPNAACTPHLLQNDWCQVHQDTIKRNEHDCEVGRNLRSALSRL